MIIVGTVHCWTSCLKSIVLDCLLSSPIALWVSPFSPDGAQATVRLEATNARLLEGQRRKCCVPIPFTTQEKFSNK
eukprot:5413750-Amphidinium_carterae.1